MKDLISVFNYSPDNRRKEILHQLLLELQLFRKNFDIMVVSHSPISEMSMGLVDFFYYDESNELIDDFNLTNKFWFRSPEIAINSSLVYPVSTHLSIYKLFYYTFNFAFHKMYNKIHFIEFDIKLKDFDLINQVNKDLDDNDAVMFHGRGEWALGVYFASTLNGFTVDRFQYDREKILNQLSESDSRMTERVTPVILCRDRKVKFREFVDLNDGDECQKNDEHNNSNLKWAVPVVLRDTDEMNFFIYNEVGTNHIVDLFVDNKHTGFEINHGPGIWTLTHIGNIKEMNEIIVFVDKIMINRILLNEDNRQKFAENNFLVYLNNEN